MLLKWLVCLWNVTKHCSRGVWEREGGGRIKGLFFFPFNCCLTRFMFQGRQNNRLFGNRLKKIQSFSNPYSIESVKRNYQADRKNTPKCVSKLVFFFNLSWRLNISLFEMVDQRSDCKFSTVWSCSTLRNCQWCQPNGMVNIKCINKHVIVSNPWHS